MSSGALKARAFLAAFRVSGSVARAAEAVGIDRTLHYRWLKNPAYKRDFEAAFKEFGDVLEGEAIRRAQEGVEEPVFYKGAVCGYVARYSDGLMQTLLKRFKPEEYGVTRTEVSGPGGGPITVTHPELAALTDDELASLIGITAKLEDAIASGGAAGRTKTPGTPED